MTRLFGVDSRLKCASSRQSNADSMCDYSEVVSPIRINLSPEENFMARIRLNLRNLSVTEKSRAALSGDNIDPIPEVRPIKCQ